MSVINTQPLAGSSGQGGTSILPKSLRFRSSASAYMNRTPASAGSRRIMTYSFWIKKTQDIADNANQTLFGAGSYAGGTQQTGFMWATYTGSSINNSIRIQSGTQGVSQDFDFAFANTYRDYAGWYHIVVAFDTTQATAANRCKVYVNGNQLGSPVAYAGRSTTISQNYDLALNNNVAQWIGQSGSSNYLDGYMTEVNFIDGQQLTPSSFGETDATTGVWKPKKYSGTYGTNGFYLNFSDNSAATAAAIGKDSSGNGNNWTPNNISLTAGATYDSMTDVPTLTSATVANYATLNPINSTATVSDGNLKSSAGASYIDALATIECAAGAGKWYFEGTLLTLTSYTAWIGVTRSTNSGLNHTAVDSYRSVYQANGTIYRDNTGIGDTATGTTFTTNDVIGVALDTATGALSFYKNGTLVNTTTNAVYSSNSWFFYTGQNGSSWAVNFGQRPFAYTPPTGFVALNTYNLPDSTIVAGNKYMDATTYTGNGSSLSVTNAGGFKPDLVWIKSRSNAYNNELYDSVRGTTKRLMSNLNNTESTSSLGLTSFNSSGFTQGGQTETGANGATYVAWQWQGNQGTNVTNTSGSITSTVSANPTAGFSVVTYTGTGSAGTVGHGLGVAPAMIINKSRDNTWNWIVYHKSINPAYYLYLNTNDVVQTNDSAAWNSTNPTSTVFSIGGSGQTNAGTEKHVAYCWAEIAGFSKFGSYTGNGSTDGPFVYTGFRPKFVLFRRTDVANDWVLRDSTRSVSNVMQEVLYADYNNAESGGTGHYIDFVSNGFKIRNAADVYNTNNGTYIYAAFAENPFKNSLAR